MLFQRTLRITFSLLGAASLAGTLWSQAAAVPVAALPADYKSTLAIGPGDMLDVNVYDVPELILKVRVSDKGDVTLPLVGSMHWGGLTASQAERMLHDDLVSEDYVKSPEVSVFIVEYATQGISVTGEVNQPGIYPLLGPHTVFDAISAAGGLTENAGSIVTILHKGDPDHPDTVMISSNGSLQDPKRTVEPGDMISVSKAGLAYVVGEVNKPGGFVMGNNTRMTVVRAVALAMGPTPHGGLKRVSVVRHQNGSVVLITLDLKQVLKGREADVTLQADDIVYVPASGVRTATDIMEKASIGAAAAAVLVH
jgi:polysaccharide export outer membrane protein